jgi:hypothetical protein
LAKSSLAELTRIGVEHWADFALSAETAVDRFPQAESRAAFRAWVDNLKVSTTPTLLPSELREDFIRLLVSTTTNFEKRSKLFKEQHPLALQVILKSGVLNGMIVVRSVDSCANILKALILNDLKLRLIIDDWNYRLVEQTTNSTVRVISRHPLITSAFATFYSDSTSEQESKS